MAHFQFNQIESNIKVWLWQFYKFLIKIYKHSFSCITKLSMNPNINISIGSIVSCFEAIHNPNTDPITRKNADQYLLDIEKYPIDLLPTLMEIVQ